MKHLFSILLTALVATAASSTWAGSDYYAKLTVSCSGTGEGKIYASTDSKTSPVYQSAAMDVTASQNAQSAPTLTFYIYAQAPAGTKFNGWTATDGVTVKDATSASTTASIKGATDTATGTVTANFEKETLTAFSVTYLAPQNGSYTVDGTTVGSGGLTSDGHTEVYKPRLVATAASGYAFNGWYTTTDGGATKTPLAQEVDYTASFIAAATVGADFVQSVTVTTLDALKASLAKDVVIEIPSGTEITVPKGETLTIAATQTLIVNGTLFVEGTLTVSGAIAGGGKISKCKYAYSQSDLRNPYGTKKYWVTKVETVSATVTGYSSTANHVTITNGKGQTFRKLLDAATPAAIICSVDSSVAINHITGITDTSKTSIGNCFSTSLSQLALLTAKQTFSSTSADTGNEHGIIDGASSYTFTYSPKNTTSGYKHTIVNGGYSCTVSSSAGGYYGNCSFYNCTSISIKNFVGKNSNAQLHIYDCTYTSSSISGFNEKTPINGSINFYSGGPYSTGNFKSGYEGFYHIYGGSWNKGGTKPAAERIATTMTATHKFYQHDDTCWYLDPKGPVVVTIDGSDEYDDMDEAFAAVKTAFGSTSSVKLTMEKNATVKSPITIPSGKTLEIELAGCCLTASTGLAINHGTFLIGDKGANLKGTEGGRVLTTSGNLIENDGTVDVTYGYYTGNVALNGGTFTTHHGRFEGNFIPKTGLDGKTVADLRGGYFAKDVTSLLREGYLQTRNYVGKFPKPEVSQTYKTTDGGYWMYSFQTLPTADLNLYNNSATTRDGYPSLADWQRRAEVMSMTQPWIDAGYTVDIVAGFDRDIVKGTATAHLTKPVSTDEPLGRDVGAVPGDLYRILSDYLVHPTIGNPADQKFYNAFLGDSVFQNVAFGVSSATAANQGTTVNLRFDLCSGAVHTDITNLKSYYALMSEYFVIGAGKTNQAMIQPESGAATFYATIAEAIAASPNGGTVKLCNDVTSTDVITIAKPILIDTNGMVFNGAFNFNEDFNMTTIDLTPDIDKAIGKTRTAYLFSLKIGGQVAEFKDDGEIVISAAGSDTISDASTLKKWNPSTLTIGAGIKKIEADTFKRFTSLRRVTVGDEVTEVGSQAFAKCYGLEHITFGKNIQSIGASAFASCLTLETITFEGDCPQLDQNEFTLTTLIRYDQDGKPHVWAHPVVSDQNGLVTKTYGKKNLDDNEWTEVQSDDDLQNYHFFKCAISISEKK